MKRLVCGFRHFLVGPVVDATRAARRHFFQRLRICSLVLVAVLMIFAFSVPSLTAANTITVNTLSDESTSGDDQCSLREAVNNANAGSDMSGGDCVAGSGNDAIVFSASGTITLGSTLPTITHTLTIDGSGQTVTIDGANSYRALQVNSGAVVSLNQLTIAQCFRSDDWGGAISNSGKLTVTKCVFSGNVAAGFQRGGAIESFGSLIVDGSTFSGNSSYCGAGIGAYGSTGLTVTNTTLSNNSAGVAGAICTSTAASS